MSGRSRNVKDVRGMQGRRTKREEVATEMIRIKGQAVVSGLAPIELSYSFCHAWQRI